MFIVDNMASAFSLDGLASSHPLSVPVERPEDLDDVFDSISYEKVGVKSNILRVLLFA